VNTGVVNSEVRALIEKGAKFTFAKKSPEEGLYRKKKGDDGIK